MKRYNNQKKYNVSLPIIWNANTVSEKEIACAINTILKKNCEGLKKYKIMLNKENYIFILY